MTLSEIATLCPPPEGMEWHGRVAGASFEYEARRTSSVWVNLRGDATQDDDACGWYVTVTACYLNMSVTTGGFLPDLPAAYFRALTAVGLAPDPEKEDLRRRLTWTEEVPTTPGRYLVDEPGKETTCWSLLEDGRWSHSSWATFVLGLVPFTDGARFLPLSNLKET